MFGRYFTAPVFDDAGKSTTAKLLFFILSINISICIIFLVPFYFISPGNFTRYLAMSSFVIASNVLSLFTARKGRVRLACIILLGSLWLIIMAGAISDGGIPSSIYAGVFVLIVVAGMLLGDNAAIITAVVSIGAGALMVMAYSAGHFPVPSSAGGFDKLLALSFYIFLMVLFQRYSTKTIRDALNKSQSELAERQKTEQALRLSEERYRLISSVSSDYMFSTQLGVDGNLHLNWVAGAFEQITGYTFDEYTSRGGWSATLHPEDRDQDSRDMITLKTNQTVTSEVRTIHKNGDIRWVRVYAQPVWDIENNRLTGIYGAVQEITVEKQAAEELEQHAEEMYILYQMSLVLATDQDMYQTMHKLLEHIRHLFVLDTIYIGVYDNDTGLITYPLYVNMNEKVDVSPRNLHENPGMSGEVIFKRRALYIPDMDAPYAQKSHSPIVIGKTHIRSFLGIPLMAHGIAIGLISVQSQYPNAYNEKQVRLLETIAAQLATALEKANLLDQLKQELIERKLAEAEIRKLNTELEQRVLERTLALSASEASLRERSIQLEFCQ